MRILFLTSFLATLSAPVWGQPTDLRVEGVTSTQALVSYVPPDQNPCSVEVSESSTYAPVVNDVNGTLFPGSNSDTGRALTTGGRRTLILGARKADPGNDGKMYSRALRADQRHFVRVTCGGVATADFVTAQIHGIAPEGLPFRDDGAGSFGFPDRDLTAAARSKPIIDPQTGAASYMVTNPRDYSHIGEYSFAAGLYFGGTDWTNPANVTSGSTGTLASTTTTNPIFVPMQLQDAFIFGNYGALNQEGILVDAGLHLYGRGTDSNASNRQVQVCLSVDSGQSCYTDSISVTLPSGASDVGTVPSVFPTAGATNPAWVPFAGWGKVVPRHYVAQGKANIVGSVLTVSSTSYELARAILNPEWAVGSKMFVAGSSPTCANNYCTIASVQNGRQLTLAESGVNLTDAAWRFHGLGFRVVKTNPTGSVSISAKYKVAKSYAMEAGAETGCSGKTVTTNVDRAGAPINPGIVGRLCVFARLRGGPGAIYFIGETVPEFRLISLGRLPTAPPSGHTSGDWLFAPVLRLPPNATIFDSEDPNTIYIGATTNAGNPAIFKGVYSGDYRETSGLFFAGANNTEISTYVNDGFTWENVTRSSAGPDLRSRILSSDSGYSEELWGSLTGGLRFVGIADNHAVFYKLSGSQDSACWVFTFDAKTGAYVDSWNTVTGGGGAGDYFGGCHAVLVLVNRVVVANNGLRFSTPTMLYGGPFTASPTHLFRNGTPDANTALPAVHDGSYDGACPNDIDQRWKDLGATGNRCVTLRFANEPCSSFATAAEKAATPCPGDPAKSYIGVNVGPGAELFDPSVLGGADSEHLVMVKRTDLGGSSFDGVFLRNAGNSYCCYATPEKLPGQCVDSAAQMVHMSGWTGSFVPYGSCAGVVQFTSPGEASSTVSEVSIYVRGHFSLEATQDGKINFAGIGGSTGYQARYRSSVNDLGKYNAHALLLDPSFAGTKITVGTAQSYVSPGFSGIAVDWRHPNGSTGFDIEIVGQTIGPVLNITPVAGQSQTYKVSGFKSVNLKAQPLLIWAGRHSFGDISSAATGDRISDADVWKYCYAYRTNECRAGSAAGDLYVSAPKLDTSVNRCNASQVAQNVLCVMPADPLLGQLVQFDQTRSDVGGARMRRLGLNLTNPGGQYVYSHARPMGETQPFKLFATQYNQGDLWSGGAMIDTGGWNQVESRTNDFVRIPVSGIASEGATHARIRFGYADYGVMGTNFYCTSRGEDCLTGAVSGPYAFEGDMLDPTACATGCTIEIPAIPGRMLVYRVEHLSGGAVTSVDALNVVAVP